MTGNKLRIALIGAGGMGKRWAGALASMSEVDFIAVADVDFGRAKAVAEPLGISASGDIESIIKNSEIKAVVIVVPNKFSAELSRRFLEAGKHVLSEKPGARMTRELEAPMRIAKEKNLRYMIGFNHRFHPSHELARKIFDEGKIGEAHFMRAVYGFGGRKDYEKEWRHSREMCGGGELIDQGIHLIDLARWFLGDVEAVKGFTGNTFWKSEVEDNGFLLMKHQNGRVSSIHASWTQWKPTYLLELYGSEGYIRIEGLGRKYGGTEKVFLGKRTEDFGATTEEVIECDPNADNSLKVQTYEFISAIREGRDPRPSAADGLEALKIIEEVYSHEK